MSVNILLTDTEGKAWDFLATSPGLGLRVLNGTSDAFDGGIILRANGADLPIVDASLTGREVTTAPIVSGGVAIQRSILVSDASVSATGFARFLDSFTNTTDSEQTFTFSIFSNSGNDNVTVTPVTTSGDATLSALDFGFTLDEGNNQTGGDSAVMHAYGDGLGLMPSSATRLLDLTEITYTLTLAAGETKSILSFATQNTTSAQAAADLPLFTSDLAGLTAQNFLAGLSREEILSVVNYSGAADVVAPFELVGSDGHRWGIDLKGRLSSLDTGALQAFTFRPAADQFTVSTGATVDSDSVTVTYGVIPGSDLTASFEYTALQDNGVIRLVVTLQNPTSSFQIAAGVADIVTGTNPLQSVFTALMPGANFPGVTAATVVDDSLSGSGGVLPALAFGHGATSVSDSRTLSGNTFATSANSVGGSAGEFVRFVYFFALNDTGLDATAQAIDFGAPDFRLLAGMSAAEVAGLRNFVLDESDRMQVTTGDGNDNDMSGNVWGDSIDGGAGDDDIAAGSSDDVVAGGDGEDAITGDDGNDILSGGAQDDDILGGEGNDTISGDAENDALGGQAGNDSVLGGLGNDTIRGGRGNDSLAAEDDADRVFGNAGTDTLNGGLGADALYGGKGDDRQSGGADNDTLDGGQGNDTLNGDNGDDVLTGGDGNDTLNGFANNDALSGGAGGDSLYGGSGDDTLTGGDSSETQINRMFGGDGSDTYIVTSTFDRLTEVAGSTATDTVLSDISFVLGADLEDLALRESAAALNATGNGQNNRISGNANANQIDGGLGADTMEGGNGNDTYRVDDAGDVVIELDGIAGGVDTVRSLVTLTLAGNVETLDLIGEAVINGTGNAGANTIIGNGRVNVLDGGLGNDTLTGLGGNDGFQFSSALGAGNVDRISDFTAGSDRIRLDDAIFTAIGTGTLTAGAFVNGTTAFDANDRILYDITTGALQYDADGNGTGAAVIFAIVDNLAALTNASFLVY